MASSEVASAQLVIFGKVSDAETGRTLQLATIQVEGSGQHAVTNPDGQFRISVAAFPVTLIIRHIGYATHNRVVEARSLSAVLIELSPVVAELDELVVSGEDPAFNIMRKVIRRKAEIRASVSSMYAEVYTRFWLYKDFDPVLMEESIRSSYWRLDGGAREFVRATRTRPPNADMLKFASAQYVPNFYDDSVLLFGTRYATATHPDALDYYEFRIGDRRLIDDTIVWDIYFTPRSYTRPLFSGHVAVMDSSYVILEMNARPQPGIVVTPPMLFHDIQFEQRFGELPGGLMVPLNLTARGAVGFGRLGANYPTARYEQFSNVTNHSRDAPTPDSLFTDTRTQRYHPFANRADFFFSRNPTITPMTPRELESLSKINPRMTVDAAFRPSGLLAAYAALDVSEDSDPTTEDDDEASTIVRKIAEHAWVWYNRVDGWNVGLQGDTDLSTGTTVTTKLGYAFERKKIAGVFGFSHPFSLGSSTLSFFGSVADETRPVFDSDLYGLFIPGMMAYAGYSDYYDYYRRRQLRFGASWENSSGFFKVSLAAQLEQHDSQEKNSNYDGWLREIHQRPNPEIQDGRLGALAMDIELGNDRVGLDVAIEHAPSGMPGNDFDFTTIRGAGRVKFNTFFNDRDRPNQLLLTVTGGASSGSVPPQRSGAVQGAIGFVSYSGSLRSLSSQALTGANYTGVFLEHDFTTGLFESLHLWRLADSGMGLLVFGGAGRVFDDAGRVSDGSPNQTDLPWYLEAGFGLSHFFRLPVRVDIGWRIDEPGWAIRIGKTNF